MREGNMAQTPESVVTPAPTTKEVNQELTIIALGDRLKLLEADLKSAGEISKVTNERVRKLEAENIRLKMERTDKELASQVEGLRKEVGKKDKELVELKRELEKFKENEKVILHRAAVADQKVTTVQNTLVTMQRSRDAAQTEVEKHDRARSEAVTQMIAASDRARRAEERLAQLEKKPDQKGQLKK
jgi:chromosome segregation ATPase